MKKLLVLSESDKINPNKELLVDYLNKNSSGKYKVYLHAFSDLLFEIRTGAVKILINGKDDIANFDLVFVRRSGKYTRFMGAITRYLDFKKVDFIDPAFREIGLSMDKASTSLRLAIKGVPIPDTYFCFRKGVEKFKRNITAGLGFPIIAKAVRSQRNEAIYILKDTCDFEKLIGESRDEFLFQKYIDIDREYRLLVMGGEVKVLEQKSKRDYGNLKVEYIDPNEPSLFLKLNQASKQMKDLAVKCTQLLSLDIAGIDICVEKETGKNYVFEVNRGPGIVHDPKRSPELKALADYLKKRLFT
jgi:glutathione synthase/RimK-type ligase-like ATP-grasp enzyme